MLGKKMVSLRKLAKRVNKATKGTCTDSRSSQSSSFSWRLLDHHHHDHQGEDDDDDDGQRVLGHGRRTPTGFLAVYVGEERRRFVVPTGYLSHPLFRMLLNKAGDEFGFDHRAGLSVPCTVPAFRDLIAAVDSSNGAFDLRPILHHFL